MAFDIEQGTVVREKDSLGVVLDPGKKGEDVIRSRIEDDPNNADKLGIPSPVSPNEIRGTMPVPKWSPDRIRRSSPDFVDNKGTSGRNVVERYLARGKGKRRTLPES